MMAALRRGTDFVWLLDDDALVNAGTLSGLLAEYARLEGEGVRVGAVGSTLLGRREPTRVTEVGASVSLFSGALRLRHHGAEIHSLGDCTDEVEYVAAASLLTRARTLRAVGPFEDIFIHYDDVAWCFRLRRAGYRVFATTRSTVRHAEWEGKAAPWLLYYDARNLLRFLRRHRPSAWPLAWARLRLQWAFLRLHGAAGSARLLALGLRHARTGELLTRARLPAVPTRPLPMGAWLPRGGRALVVARRGADAARWEALAARQGARLRLLACDNPHGGGPLGRARHLLGLAWGHLRGQLFLLRHPEAPALIDAACAKNYPFPFLCRRRAFWRPEGEGAALFQEDAAPPAE